MDQVSNAQLIADFKDDLVLLDWSPSTVEGYPLFVSLFSDFIAPDSLLAVNKGHLSKYLAHLRSKKLTHASLQKYFTGLSTFFEFLMYDERYEDKIDYNPVLPFRKHYFKGNKNNNNTSERRRCISLDQARALIARVLDPKERAVLMLLFKTGMRLHELSELDLANVNFADQSISINKTRKRKYSTVFFDEETAYVLNRYLTRRKPKPTDPLFTDRYGKRLSSVAIARIVQKHAVACGLHDPNSDRSRLQSRFSTHCTRHWFTTWLRRADMDEKFIKQLRGDKGRGEAFDTYNHIEHDELKDEYLRCIQKLKLLP